MSDSGVYIIDKISMVYMHTTIPSESACATRLRPVLHKGTKVYVTRDIMVFIISDATDIQNNITRITPILGMDM